MTERRISFLSEHRRAQEAIELEDVFSFASRVGLSPSRPILETGGSNFWRLVLGCMYADRSDQMLTGMTNLH